MRRAYLLLLLLIWVASRCSHTHTVSRDEGSATHQQGHAEKPSHTEKRDHAEKHDKEDTNAGKDGTPERRARVLDGALRPEKSSPPLPASPSGLLREGGAASIQDRLMAHGYLHRDTRTDELDGPTEKALRDFQRDNGLPATGIPDDLTVKKLGLSPKDLFRASPTGGDKR